MSGGGGGGGSKASKEERELYKAQADIARGQWDEYKKLGSPIQEQLATQAAAPISESEYATNIGRAGPTSTSPTIRRPLNFAPTLAVTDSTLARGASRAA